MLGVYMPGYTCLYAYIKRKSNQYVKYYGLITEVSCISAIPNSIKHEIGQ